MRPLEILIVVALAPLVAGLAIRPERRPRWLRSLAWAALATTVLHLVFEGYRWHMIPAYALAVCGCCLARRVRDGASQDSGWRRAARFGRAGLGAAAWVVGVVLAAGHPVFRYPAPTGPYTVGTAQMHLVDTAREDPFAPSRGQPRELLVVAWYPAAAPGAEAERFWPDAAASTAVLAKTLHLPPINLLQHLRLVRSHSSPGAPAAPGRYPVLVFSHGYASTPWQNTVQMEELASHGFMVFSIGHTYESAAIVFPGGRTAYMNQARMETAMRRGPVAKDFLKQSLELWVADTRYVVDELARMDQDSATRFGRRLDLSRLGVFGMSFGGAAAGEFCARDPRCKAGMNMDGHQHGTLPEHPLAVPFLYFAAGVGTHENDAIYAASRGDFYTVQVRQATHYNFTDANLVLPILKYAGVLGSIDGEEMESILNAYTVAFFEQYLQTKPSPLLDAQPPLERYPEVFFRARKHPSLPAAR